MSSRKPPTDPKKHSVLTSDVVNEAEQTFRQLAHKESGLVSQCDMVIIIRSMGMNPTDEELAVLFDDMQIRDPERERQERIERDEREKKEKEKREKEKAEAALKKDDKKGKAQPKGGKKKDEKKEEAYVYIPPEKRPVVDWASFIHHVEPFYKDNRNEESEITKAMRVFDKEGKGWIHKDELVKVMTTIGEDILSPLEVATLNEMFPTGKVYILEFAQKMQGTYVPPAVSEGKDDSDAASLASSRRQGTARTTGTAGGGDNMSTMSGSVSHAPTDL